MSATTRRRGFLKPYVPVKLSPPQCISQYRIWRKWLGNLNVWFLPISSNKIFRSLSKAILKLILHIIYFILCQIIMKLILNDKHLAEFQIRSQRPLRLESPIIFNSMRMIIVRSRQFHINFSLQAKQFISQIAST